MSNPFIGQVILFAGTFAPRGWALCNGQILPINQNTALFAILGTTYGGNGATTFGLPDLRGRVAVSQGQGPGLSNYTLGEQTGTENVTLNISQMPSHNHLVQANNSAANPSNSPSNAFLSQTNTVVGRDVTIYPTYATSLAAASTLNATSVQAQGGSQPHSNVQPVLALNYIIALQGIYPSRS
jgi:microcystin-dependent protein